MGFLGGAQVGANVPVQLAGGRARGRLQRTSLKGSGNDSIGDALNTRTDWTSTSPDVSGMAFDRFLVYGKGGLALAQDQSSLTDLAGNTASSSFTRTGWTAGAGLEYAFNRNWSAKLDTIILLRLAGVELHDAVARTVTSNAISTSQEVKAG